MSDERSPEEIQRDIEKTRERLAADLDELSYRVSPEGLRDRAETGLEDLKEVALGVTQDTLRGVTDRAEAVSESFSARLRARPLPLSLLGAAFGVGWLLVNAAKEGSRERSAAPVLTPGETFGTARVGDASGEVVHEPTQKPEWFASSSHGRPSTQRPSTQTLLIGATALLGGAAVGALLPGRQDSGRQASRPSSAPRARSTAERIPVMPPVSTKAAGTSSASPEDEVFRRHFETTFKASGRDYSYYEPAYRYGADLPGAPMHRSRTWDQAEADAQRDWERSYHEPWNDVKDAVRQGWHHGLESRRG